MTPLLKAFSTLFMLFAVVSAIAQPADDEKDRKKMQASRISAIHIWEYAYEKGILGTKKYLNSYRKFDQQGYTVEKAAAADTSGAIGYKQIFEYDEGNRVVEEYWYTSDTTLNSRWSYQYNEKGQLLRKLGTDPADKPVFRATYKYYPNGKLLEEVVLNDDLSMAYRKGYSYNSKGQLVEMLGTKPKGKADKKLIYTYDDKGRLVEENKYSASGALIGITTYKYDVAGNRIEELVLGPGKKFERKWTFKYDAKGNRTEMQSFFPDGTVDYKWIYKYNPKGNRIEATRYDGKGIPRLLYKYVYEYYP